MDHGRYTTRCTWQVYHPVYMEGIHHPVYMAGIHHLVYVPPATPWVHPASSRSSTASSMPAPPSAVSGNEALGSTWEKPVGKGGSPRLGPQ